MALLARKAPMTPLQAWTDYPFAELGDTPGEPAPIRPCLVLHYDGNKYCQVEVGDTLLDVKAGYLYRQPGRSGDAPPIRYQDLVKLTPGYRRRRGKPASFTISYVVYEPDYQPGFRYCIARTMLAAVKQCIRYGKGSVIVRQFDVENRKGVSKSYADSRFFIYG